MKLVVFGLTVSSSWGNGHATLWRGLARALAGRGHSLVFFEKDVPYYAEHRDLDELPGGRLHLYRDWASVRRLAEAELLGAEVGMVTSYCPDAQPASDLVLSSAVDCRCFYDMDTGVTLDRLRHGQPVAYIPAAGLGPFDLVLSFTGGAALDDLMALLGARRVAPLYGSVDPAVHVPVPGRDAYQACLSYLGTYSPDRQQALERLFLEPARRMPERRFAAAGAMYPADFAWQPNLYFHRHLAPSEHPAFYCSSPLTLNVTRAAMAAAGYCPSPRLFEAGACGVPVLSDDWEGLAAFFEPGREILVAHTAEEAMEAIRRPAADLAAVGRAARQRTLDEHTASHRARELERLLDGAPREVTRVPARMEA